MSARAREALARVEFRDGPPDYQLPSRNVRIARLEAELARVEREAYERAADLARMNDPDSRLADGIRALGDGL